MSTRHFSDSAINAANDMLLYGLMMRLQHLGLVDCVKLCEDAMAGIETKLATTTDEQLKETLVNAGYYLLQMTVDFEEIFDEAGDSDDAQLD